MLPEVDAMTEGGILIIEDNPVNALILRSMLRKRGYDTVLAADGVEGVEMISRYLPRLVLMDLQMPRLDGFAAAKEIQRLGGEATPPIIAVTANANEAVEKACAEAGFSAILGKPILYEELMAAIHRCLGEV